MIHITSRSFQRPALISRRVNIRIFSRKFRQLEADMAPDYSVVFPEYLDDYENETESKGYLVGVQIVLSGRLIELTIYDHVRLVQDIQDELTSDGYFVASNLLVVSRVTREHVHQAVRRMASG